MADVSSDDRPGLREWAGSIADADALRLFAGECAQSSLEEAAVAFHAAYGDDEAAFLSWAKRAWAKR